METQEKTPAELILSPLGHVHLVQGAHAVEALPVQEFEKITSLFAKSPSFGLLHLGIQEFHELPSSFLFWQLFCKKFISSVCKLNSSEDAPATIAIAEPDPREFQELINQAPFIKGSEYLTLDVLHGLWKNLSACLHDELESYSCSVQSYLQKYNQRWNLVGRICFHLAENKNNEARPFAFLATFTTELSQRAQAQHLPLKRALEEYSGEKNHAALLSLLLPVQKAASQSAFIKNLTDTGALFQPLAWTVHEAHQFLKEIPLMESSGIMVRVPNWWNSAKPPRPQVVVKLGDKSQVGMGLNALLDFDMRLAFGDGEELTQDEWQSVLDSSGNLVKMKGRWVEIDREKLQQVLQHWNKVKEGAKNGLTMAESLRLLAGGGSNILANEASDLETTAQWSHVVAGDWLKGVLQELKDPQRSQEKYVEQTLKAYLKADLRPYQLQGVQWLWLLYKLRLGGCLADDMGLGKTIQVLSLFMLVKQSQKKKKPHLLVLPASLLGNWQAEINRFTPTLDVVIVHNSVNKQEIKREDAELKDLVITTYGSLSRLEWLRQVDWDLVVLDEAQLIKNPATKQTLAAKSLKAQIRLTLTGTPVENRLGDLWSLFDFTHQGLLGSSKQFSGYAKKADKGTTPAQYTHFISTLRTLTQPYILRRLKSDKKIITDLPDKTEVQSYCALSKEQVHLYKQALDELKEKLKEVDGIGRRGLVLASLLSLKQICNHPAQWLGYGDYQKEASGKFIRLEEICEEIAAKQEKVLIFTQFRNIIPALSSHLARIFGCEGLTLHGDTQIKKRQELVSRFQDEQGPPFFVLSLKAGGTGLNLTCASHVIHFDRWWNPAVENQATDRAYRIGQKHPVLVHKFICRGTIEEKIDELIASKKNLSCELLEGGGELQLTELSDEELLNTLSLDMQKALGEF